MALPIPALPYMPPIWKSIDFSKTSSEPIQYIYLRNSKNESDTLSQELDIMKYIRENKLLENNLVKIIDEGVKGKVNRYSRNLGPLLDRMKRTDILYVSELSRLGRNMQEISAIIQYIVTEKKIPLFNVKAKQLVDTTTLQGRLTVECYSISADIEHEMQKARMKAGVEKAIQLGTRQAPKIPPYHSHIIQWRKENKSYSFIAKQIKVSTQAIYAYCKRNTI